MPYYIIYSRTNQETKCIQHMKKHLHDEDVKLEFAIMKKEMINLKKGEKLTKVYNALPGYIFLRTDEKLNGRIINELLQPQDSYYFLHYADGSLELKRDDEVFACQIFDLPKVITADNVFIKNGDTVEIVHGAFTSLKGKIIKIDRRRSRVDVSLKFMERDLKLTLPFNSITLKDEGKEENDK